MEKIAIITDSCSDIKKEYRELYDIHVLPIQIQYDGKSYRDGVDITSNDIYAIQDEKVIKTSSPVGKDLFNLLDQLKDKGYTHVIGLFLSSGISGTGNQMRLFCQTYEKLKCHIVDSQSASVGLGVIAVSLAKYREEGKSFDELIEIADFLCYQNYAYFSIDDLNYLQKGGRIGKASAFLGTTLKIKPILSFEKENGEITLDDCENVNNAITDILDKDDYIKEQYFLEVSSTGVEKMIRKDKHLKENIGEYITIKLFKPINNFKEYVGKLKSFDDQIITIEVENEELNIERKNISLIKKYYDWNV